jgi:Uma2 family endonuclease
MPATSTDIQLMLPPRTALEVFDMLPEGTLAEVIDNTIYMPPSPDFEHQDTLGDLYLPIKTYVKALDLGKCVTAPMDVYLNDRNVVQPDILFISTENLGIIKGGKIKGTPDLVIEVLSSNRKYDLENKKAVYESVGVKEYFVVDPDTKETFTWYHDGGKYIQQESKKGEIKSLLLKKTFQF